MTPQEQTSLLYRALLKQTQAARDSGTCNDIIVRTSLSLALVEAGIEVDDHFGSILNTLDKISFALCKPFHKIHPDARPAYVFGAALDEYAHTDYVKAKRAMEAVIVMYVSYIITCGSDRTKAETLQRKLLELLNGQ